MTNPDLIKTLEKLNPTEGEWIKNHGAIYSEQETKGEAPILYLCTDSTQDDDTLITLAPTMRLAILEMAKEIEEYKVAIEKYRLALDGE